ncbi:MAG: hypothetical protein AAB885_03050, partial [Patescibacteria group bacterium]
GGSIHMEEPIIDFESTNGIRFRAYARHLPVLRRILFEAKDYKRMPGHILFSNGQLNYILARKTVEELLPVMDKLIENYAQQISEVETKIEEAFSSHPNLARKAGCVFCGSSTPYTRCCGKRSKNN